MAFAPNLGTYQLRPVASLKPYEKNARTHSAEQVEQLVRSIKEFGFTNPLLIDEQDRIIAGHGRL
jgi:ParB-like chromosome segregation protein Spo0J